MNEVHEALAGTLSLDELLTLILDRVFEHLRPEQAVVLLRGDDGEYRPAATRSTSGSQADVLYSRSLEREVGERRMAALVLDAASDERFAVAQSILSSGVRTLLAAPLLDPGKTLGMIVLSSHRAGTALSDYGDGHRRGVYRRKLPCRAAPDVGP